MSVPSLQKRLKSPAVRKVRPIRHFRQWLINRMKEAGVSQGRLVQDLGIPQPDVSDYVRGAEFPGPRVRWMLLRYFNASKDVTDYWMSW